MARITVVRTQYVALSPDIVERMAYEQACESPEDLLARIEDMRQEGEFSDSEIRNYLQDYNS